MHEEKLHDWLVSFGFGAAGLLSIYFLSWIKEPLMNNFLFFAKFCVCMWSYNFLIDYVGMHVLRRVLQTYGELAGWFIGWAGYMLPL